MIINDVFPTAVGISEYNGIINKDIITNLEKHRLTNNSGSINTDVLSLPELSHLKDFIQTELNQYFKQVHDPENDDNEVYITQSWANFTDMHESHHVHSHPNSFISGVFYVQANDRIEFQKTVPGLRFEIPAKTYNQYNSMTWWMPAKTGTLLLFPSSLVHYVPVVDNDYQRISIAFNVFLKGTIGSNVALTELKL